jgi:hypothetical protein
MHQDADQDRMLDDVGRAAGVKCVAIVHPWKRRESMIRKDGSRFSEKIMPNQKAKA